MKQVINKIVASLSLMMVFCMHVYFVMLLGTKPAMAANAEKQEAVVKVSLLGAESKEAATAAQADKDATAMDDDNDAKGINIKINEEDGISITGSESLVKQLKNLEKTIEDKVNDREMIVGANYSIGKTLENVLVPIMIFLISFGFAGYTVYAKQKTRKEYLETIRTLAQNNQPIPQELLNNLNASSTDMFSKTKWNNNYGDANSIQGIKYLFIGLGIAGFMILIDDYGVPAALGFLFIVIGGFHIVKSQLLQKQMDAKKTEAALINSTTSTSTTTPQV